MFMNTGSQAGEDQDLIPSFGTTKCDDFEDNWPFPQLTDLKRPMNTCVAMKESNLLQNNTGALRSTALSNQVPGVNPPSAIPYEQSFNSTMSNEHWTKIVAAVEDPIANISLFRKYLKPADDDRVDTISWTQQDLQDLEDFLSCVKQAEGRKLFQNDTDAFHSTALSNQVSDAHPPNAVPCAQHFDSTKRNELWTQAIGLNTPMNTYVAMEESRLFQRNTGGLHSTALSNQVSAVHPPTAVTCAQRFNSSMSSDTGALHSTIPLHQRPVVHPPTAVPCTQSFESSMSNEHWKKIEAVVEDPTADISLFEEYLNQGDGGVDATIWTQQDTEDFISSVIAKDKIWISGVINCQDEQKAVLDSSANSQFQLPVQNALENTDIQKQSADIKVQGVQFGSGFVSSSTFTEFRDTSSCNATNLKKFDDQVKIPQMIGFKPIVNYSVSFKESKPCLKETGASQVTDNPNELFAKGIKTSKLGPLRTTRFGVPGRCRLGEIPLYLQSEPENAKDKKIWRRAIIAHKHRMNKKNELTNNANKIEYLKKEMDELRNKLRVVTAERDTLKTTVDTIKCNSFRGVQFTCNQ